MSYENTFLYNEVCPRCRKKGNDKSGDNLGVYSDGHAHCWSCGFYRPPTCASVTRIHRDTKPLSIVLPDDCTTTYSDAALEWVAKYDFTKQDLLKQGVLWSKIGIRINKKDTLLLCNDILIFPVWISGELMGYNCRYFGTDSRVPKWIVRGKLQNVLHILPGDKTLVITEDILSAMKVNIVGHAAMPIYGMHAVSKFKPLRILGYKSIYLWLDPNMKLEMASQSRVGSLEGLKVIPIFSERDPKEHNREDIWRYLNVHIR